MMLDTSQHRSILVRLLKDMYSDPLLAPYLGFAALLFYDLPRFLVDLDFDLLDISYEEQVYERLHKILSAYGTIKEARNKRYSIFFLLSYTNKLKGAQNIKIEVNKRNFGSRYETKQYLGVPLRVMVPEDMVAHKLVAMYERIGRANRDIFDVWFFLSNNWPINEKIIERRTGMTYKAFLARSIELLEKIDKRNILAGIGELLSSRQKAWVKDNLIDETVFLLRLLQENVDRFPQDP